MQTRYLIVKLVLLFFTKFVSCDDIFGCGGFVKSSFTINYSKVEIKLYTKHGSLKYQTDCAPHNGYYLIPLYDKGDYILKIEPPKGWSFEPESIDLHVDGTTDPCSRNEDINFQFKGFTLSGQVLSRDGSNGPSDIKLVLHSSNGQIVNITLSQRGGHYNFPYLLPGRYTLEASHPTWIFENSQESLQVKDDNVVTKNKIVIAGYDVQGSVLSDGLPIQGVHFLLFTKSKTASKPLYCDTKAVKGFSHETQKQTYLCHVTSSVSGMFTFPSLPPGDYQLVPFYKGEHIEFDVSPSKLDFTVKEGSVSIRESFQIQGFSVSGWVGTGPKGLSLPDVSISINGQLHTKTDKNGIYHLENMRTGTYLLEFKKDLYGFQSVEMNISPNTPRLSDVYAEKFAACGRLVIDEYPSGLGRSDRKVVLRSVKDNQQELVAVEANGSFCRDVAPGEYEVEAVVSETESSFGLKFIPDKIAFTVLNEPFMKIEFRQLRAKVGGKVKCIASCSGLALELEPQTQDSRPNLKIEVSSEGDFLFDKCLPGEYVLSVVKEDWCFQSKSIRIVVVDKDVLNLQLQQTGFQAAVTLSHASPFKVKYPSGAVHTIDLQESRNVLCLPESGSYEFLPLGCHLYKKDAFKFDTQEPTELSLSPIKHLVSGNVLTEIKVADLKVVVHRPDGDEVISLQEPISMEDKMHRYTFSVFALPHEELEITVSSKQLLFRIPDMRLQVADDCLEGAVQFIGRQGIFLKGSIRPPVPRVSIKLHQGDKLRAHATTDEFGLYSVGPLEEDIRSYQVTAEAEGYAFHPTGDPGHFRAFQLVNVYVTLISKDTGEPLQGVLVSLTGGKDFRQNTVTKDSGKLTFHGMSPGTYYLRPMLKEYSFDPAYIRIEVEEGKHVYVEVSGTRVAYSVRGVVTSLTGEAEVGVALEAVQSEGGVVEEAVSESGGDFRIRGLKPGSRYKLRVKPQSHIERSVPNEIDLQVNGSDITGIRMIVFRPYGQMDVSGSIVTTQEILHTIKVRLYRDDQLVHSLTPGGSSFFFLPSLPLDHRSYLLRLETTLPGTTLPSTTFTANTTFIHLVLKCPDPEPHRHHSEHEVMGAGSAIFLPLFLILGYAAYKHEKVLALLASGFGGGAAVSASPSAAESGRGKKLKPKKIQ